MSFLTFEDALKGSRAYNLIRNDFRLGLGHAYMVVSPDEETVSEFFTLVAATVFCDTQSACGDCVGCAKVAHGNHEDVFHFNREGTQIKVADVKELTSSTELKSSNGTKLYFVYRADLMNAAAQNKLLKTIEEPPKGVTIFLGVSNESAMLSTIRSRCRKVYMDVFAADKISDTLLGLGCEPRLAEIAADCSEGQLGKAYKIAKSPEYAELFNSVLDLLAKLQKSTDIITLDRLPVVNEKTEEFFNVLSIILRDILAVKEGNEIVSKQIGEEISSIAAGFSARAVAEIISLVNTARRKLTLNVNKTATLDSLFFSILEVKYKWR